MKKFKSELFLFAAALTAILVIYVLVYNFPQTESIF